MNYIFVKLVVGELAGELDLGLEAYVEVLVNQRGCQLLLDLSIHGFIVLMRELIVVADGLLDDLGAPVAETRNELLLALLLELVGRLLHQVECLVLELVAAQTSHHDPLVWQVQLLLLSNLPPSVTHEHTQPVHRRVLALIRLRE